MNILRLSFSNLRHNALSNIFNVLILALGIAIIVTLLHVSEQIEQRFERDLTGIDLVVGAKGSPIQLILSSVFHMDIPNGNIPLAEAEKIEKNPMVQSAIPLALGDNYHGFRIVGTTPDYAKHYNASFAAGGYWKKGMQAVIGSEVARISQFRIGQQFVGSHGVTEGGEEHKEFPYEVTGILAPTGTVIDRLILTDVTSVWYIHEHHHEDNDEDKDKDKDKVADTHHDHHHDDDDEDKETAGHNEHHHNEKEDTNQRPPGKEITSMLITYKTPLAMEALPRLINRTSSMQAASPDHEMRRLTTIIGFGGDAVQAFGGLLVFIAAMGFFMTLFNAVNDRSYEIALMRILGATRKKIFAFVLAEGLALGIAGTVLGIILGHILAYGVQCWIESTRHITLNSVGFHPYEILGAVVAIGLSAVISIIPAFIAYRVNVVEVISRGS